MLYIVTGVIISLKMVNFFPQNGEVKNKNVRRMSFIGKSFVWVNKAIVVYAHWSEPAQRMDEIKKPKSHELLMCSCNLGFH